ncbi:MAG TPA: DUF2752 domain-containing protein [Candidatus Angelobacter sp.]|nr:DUF2752 domain-containing protein [Candidatus Angelobacter sp.]
MTARFKIGLAATTMLAGLAVVYRFAPTEYAFYPRCLFYATTHWLCPGCGSTRALHALLHGDLRSALHYNALFTLLAPIVFLWFAFYCYQAARSNRFPPLAVPRSATIPLVAVIVLFTIARNTLFHF